MYFTLGFRHHTEPEDKVRKEVRLTIITFLPGGRITHCAPKSAYALPALRSRDLSLCQVKSHLFRPNLFPERDENAASY